MKYTKISFIFTLFVSCFLSFAASENKQGNFYSSDACERTKKFFAKKAVHAPLFKAIIQEAQYPLDANRTTAANIEEKINEQFHWDYDFPLVRYNQRLEKFLKRIHAFLKELESSEETIQKKLIRKRYEKQYDSLKNALDEVTHLQAELQKFEKEIHETHTFIKSLEEYKDQYKLYKRKSPNPIVSFCKLLVGPFCLPYVGFCLGASLTVCFR